MTAEKEMVVTESEASAQSEAKDTDNPLSGGGGAENVFSVVNSLENGDWDTAGLSAMSVGIDAVGLAADPLGSLASWGVGWLIEHVWFLREPFDALMGDPNEISGMAGTWQNIGDEIKTVADGYRRAAAGTAEWEGKAGDAYRGMGAEFATSVEALSSAGKGMKGAVNGAGTVVNAVRGIVRDLIATAVGEIAAAALRWLAASAATAGIAIGGAIADAVRLALKWADKISGWMHKLAEVLTNLSKHLDKLGATATSVRKKVDGYFNLLSNPPEGNLVKIQPQQGGVSGASIDDAASKVNKNADNWRERSGLWQGGGEFKPFMRGEIFQPHVAAGGDGGMTKLATDAVKEHGKLDDGEREQQQSEEKK